MLASFITEGANVREGEFRAWDDMGVEAEVAEFLYALVRVLKPRVVVESGTGRGYASFAIAAALDANGAGVLHTFEPSRSFQDEARGRLEGLPVEFHDGLACEGWDGPADLVFVDSWGAVRAADLARWVPSGLRLVVHDAHEHRALLPADQGLVIDTPRGLWVRL